jgi:uncharacterized membrane protein
MIEFLTAVVFFLLAHIIPPIPMVRRYIINLAGQRIYVIAYSLLSLALIVWVIAAAHRAPYVALWAAQRWQAFVPLIGMPFALWFIIGGVAEPNPLSISLYSKTARQLGPMARVTRHPVLWGFLLWALSHVPPNGNLVAVILFGGMAILALGGFWLVDRRAQQRLGQANWLELAHSSPLIPFSAIGQAATIAWSRLLIWAATAIVIFLWLLLQGHALLIGVDPLSTFGL